MVLSENLPEIIDKNLQCTICNEVFICPSVINCGHSFCKECIQKWQQEKNPQATCPICRSTISITLPNHTLAAFIDEYRV